MTPRRRKHITAFAAFVAVALFQVCVQAGLSNPATGDVVPQRIIAVKLTTKNSKPIIVNGNSMGPGGTLLTGATIETPDQVSAKLDLGDAGIVQVEPNSKIQLDFDADGNVRVKVLRGCLLVKKKVNGLGEADIYTDTVSEKTNKKRRHMAFCYLPNGQLTPYSCRPPKIR